MRTKLLLLSMTVFCIGSIAFAEENLNSTESAVEAGNETTAAVIDTAEDAGKGVTENLVDQAAGGVSDIAGSELAKMGKDYAAQQGNEQIEKAADSARARYGIEQKSGNQEENIGEDREENTERN